MKKTIVKKAVKVQKAVKAKVPRVILHNTVFETEGLKLVITQELDPVTKTGHWCWALTGKSDSVLMVGESAGAPPTKLAKEDARAIADRVGKSWEIHVAAILEREGKD